MCSLKVTRNGYFRKIKCHYYVISVIVVFEQRPQGKMDDETLSFLSNRTLRSLRESAHGVPCGFRSLVLNSPSTGLRALI